MRRQVFIPHWARNSATFYVRTTSASASAYGMVRDQVKALNPLMPVYSLKTLEAQLDETLLTERLIALLSAGFGLLATLLASVGLYGVMAFVVARRRKELGIRLALGARPGLVIWLVMREVLVLLAIGLAVGVPAGIALGRFVSARAVRHPPGRPVDRDGDGGPAGRRVGRWRASFPRTGQAASIPSWRCATNSDDGRTILEKSFEKSSKPRIVSPFRGWIRHARRVPAKHQQSPRLRSGMPLAPLQRERRLVHGSTRLECDAPPTR